jgi:hypothetical protein
MGRAPQRTVRHGVGAHDCARSRELAWARAMLGERTMKRLGLLLTLALGLVPACVGTDGAIADPEALTYTQYVEAEGATGPAIVVSDPTANAGQLLRMSIVQTVYLSFSTTAAIQGGTLRARRFGGTCNPVVYVTLDGVALAAPSITSTAWADYAIGPASSGAGAHTISLYYRIGATGCQLDVDDIALTIYVPPPTHTATLEAETATGAGANENDPLASAGQVRSLTAVGPVATLAWNNTGPVVGATFRARGGVGGACGPNGPFGLISIDGVSVFGGWIPQTALTDIPLSAGNFGAGPHTITLSARFASTACPIRFDRFVFTTNDPPPPPPPPVTTVYEAEAATGSGTVESDVNAHGGQLRSFTVSETAASIVLTTTGTITSGSVRVQGGACAPIGRVSIDGTIVWGTSVTQTSWTDVAFSGPGLPAGTHTLELYARGATTSCPMRFDSVTLVTNP